MVQFFAVLHTALRWQWQNVDETLNSLQTPHSSPSWVSNGMSVVRILEEIDRIITALSCSLLQMGLTSFSLEWRPALSCMLHAVSLCFFIKHFHDIPSEPTAISSFLIYLCPLQYTVWQLYMVAFCVSDPGPIFETKQIFHKFIFHIRNHSGLFPLNLIAVVSRYKMAHTRPSTW